MTSGGCPACGGELVDGPSHGWLRCDACGSWRRERMPTPSELDAVHEQLYFGASAHVDMTDRRLLAQYVRILDGHASLAGRRVVDVGAGDAGAAAMVAEAGGDYAAVENNETALDGLRDAGIEAFPRMQDASAGARFDACLAVEVVEHLLEPRPFVQSVRDGLQAGAPMLVTTPNAASLHGRLRGGAWWAAALPAHVTLYTVGGLRSLLADCGFEVVRRHRFVDYGHGRAHQAAQTALQLVGADGGLRVIARAV